MDIECGITRGKHGRYQGWLTYKRARRQALMHLVGGKAGLLFDRFLNVHYFYVDNCLGQF